MMKKRILVIGIAVLVVIALVVAMLLLLKDQGAAKPIDASDPFENISTEVLVFPDGAVTEIAAENFNSAPDFKMAVAYDEKEDKYTCTMQDNPEDYYYSETYMNLLVATLTDMRAKSIAASGDTVDPEDYGITEKSLHYTLTLKDGEQVGFRLGGITPLGNGYYCKRDDSSVIYIIEIYPGSTLERDLYEMRTMAIYPVMESYYDLYRMRIEYPDGRVVDSRQLSDEEVKNGSSFALFQFTEPIKIGINDDAAKNAYYTPALSLSIHEILQDNLDNLDSFGLDNPISIRFFNKKGEEKTLLLGKSMDEIDEYRYGMLEGKECVFSVRGPFDFLTMDIYKLVDQTVWSHSVNDIKSLHIKADGQEYLIYIDAYVNDDNPSDQRFYAEMDKVPLDTKSTRLMYVELVSLPNLGNVSALGVDPETLRQGTPYFTMDAVYDNDEKHSVKLYMLNDMQLAADVDGNMLFYTSRSQINKILDYCRMLREGQEIPEI